MLTQIISRVVTRPPCPPGAGAHDIVYKSNIEIKT